MTRYINADVFANSLRQFCKDVQWGNAEQKFSADQIIGALEMQPTVDVREMKRGTWQEKQVLYDDCIPAEWHRAKCSACGMYHTIPYFYHFRDDNFCPNCGADMRGGLRDS